MILMAAVAMAGNPMVLGDPDGISVKPGLLVNVRAAVDREGSSIALQRARPVLRGTVWGDKATYFFQAELLNQPSVLDAVIQVNPTPALSVHAGRMLVPTTRSQATPVPKLMFHGFSSSNNRVRGGRQVGVQALFEPPDHPFHAYAGVFEGGGLFARATLDVFGRLPLNETAAATEPDGETAWSVGASVSHQPSEEDANRRVVGVDTAFRAGPMRFQAEGFYDSGDQVPSWSGYGQVSVAPVPELEVAVRADTSLYGRPTLDGLVNVYLSENHLRLGLQGTVLGADYTLALQQQLWF